MWIEHIEFTGFAPGLPEKLDFGQNMLNIIEVANKDAGSMIPHILTSSIYGVDREDQSLPMGDSISYMVACVQGIRHFRIRRSLDDNVFTVHEPDGVEKDITSMFLRGGSFYLDRASAEPALAGAEVALATPPSVGYWLTNLNRKEFLDACTASQQLPAHLSQITEYVFAGVSPSQTKLAAIKVIRKCLSEFVYQSHPVEMDSLIDQLRNMKTKSKALANSLQMKRQAIPLLLERFASLDSQLEHQPKPDVSSQYFQLCLRVAQIDGQLIQLRAQQAHFNGIQQQLSRLDCLENFRVDAQEEIEQLWSKRKSAVADVRQYEQELSPKLQDYEATERSMIERWGKLQNFTAEQTQALKSAAERFLKVEGEISRLSQHRQHIADGVDEASLSTFAEARRAILSLSLSDVHDAKAYTALIVGFRKQLVTAERGKHRAEALIKQTQEREHSKGDVTAVLNIFRPATKKREDQQVAEVDIERHIARVHDVQEKITKLEARMESLAQRVDVADGATLLKYIEEYSSATSELKELDKIDQLIAEEESSYKQLREELKPFFKQAGRIDANINATSTYALAQEVDACLKNFNDLNTTFTMLTSAANHLQFLTSEVRTIEQGLAEHLIDALGENPTDVESGYREFYSKLAQYHHWQALNEQLVKIKAKYNLGDDREAIGSLIYQLEQEDREAWRTIKDLADRFPEIADSSPPCPDKSSDNQAPSQSQERQSLKQEYDNLKIKLKDFLTDYSQRYPEIDHSLKVLEKELDSVINSRSALKLAREVLEQMIMDELSKACRNATVPEDSLSEPLPIIIDAKDLTAMSIDFELILRLLLNLVSKQQVILICHRHLLASAEVQSLLDSSSGLINVLHASEEATSRK